MGNFTSCKIYIEKLKGDIDLSQLEACILQLQDQNIINQDIDVYYSPLRKKVEIRFSAKWYPTMLGEIFPNSEYEIWNITSDEGGWKDQIRYYPSTSNEIQEVAENTKYRFDQIKVKGNTQKINENLKRIFGSGIINANRKTHEDFIEINIGCTYTSNNYFRNKYEKQINIIESNNIPIEDSFGQETELWDLNWDIEKIDFKNRFYKEVLNKPNGKTEFPFINSIEFSLSGRITNIFEWNENGLWSNWEHRAINTYQNCVNKQLLMFQNQRNTEGNKR